MLSPSSEALRDLSERAFRSSDDARERGWSKAALFHERVAWEYRERADLIEESAV